MSALMLAMPFNKNKRMEFDPTSGVANEYLGSSAIPIKGNMHIVGSHCVSIYADGGILYLQVDNAKWQLGDPAVTLSYSHDFSSQSTSFTVEDSAGKVTISYPSWWKSLGRTNIEFLPEMDEEQDYLAYVFSVWGNKILQDTLLEAWTN